MTKALLLAAGLAVMSGLTGASAGAGEEIRDPRGRLIGVIQARGDLLEARDPAGRLRGRYYPRRNQTRSPEGRLVATGNVLSAMLLCRSDLPAATALGRPGPNCPAASSVRCDDSKAE